MIASIVDRCSSIEGGLRVAGGADDEVEWFPERIATSSRFTGRFDELWRLHGLLTGSALASQQEVRSGAVVSGMGGSGKSLLVLEYAHRFRRAWPGGVVWLTGHGFDHDDDGSSSRHAAQALTLLASTDLEIDAAGEMDLAELRSEVQRWFDARGAGRVLWVVDDLADDADLADWLAPMTDAVTIVTTRVRTYDGVLRPLRLDELSERDAFDLLTREHRPDDEQQQAAAHTIVERLGRHALSLDVTRCRVRSSTDYESLLNRLDQRALQTIEQAGRNVGNLAVDHTASITATLADSIEDLSDLGARALDICAHFDAVPIPDDLMTAIVGYVDETEEFDAHDDAIDGLADLDRHSLARREGETTRVHRLVIDLAREDLDRRGGWWRVRRRRRRHPDDVREAVQMATASSLAEEQDPSRRRQKYEAASTLSFDGESPVDLELARYENDLREFDRAIERLEKLCSWRVEHLGPDDESTFEAREELADLVGDVDPVASAEAWRSIVADRERVDGHDAYETVMAQKSYAARLGLAEDLAAIDEWPRVIDAFIRVFGPDDRETLMARRAFAGSLAVLGETGRAVDAARVVVDEFERLHDPDDDGLFRARLSLANYLRAADDPEAVEQYERVIDDFQAVFSADAPAILSARAERAHALESFSPDLAVDAHSEVVTASTRSLGPDHPDVLDRRLALGVAILLCSGDREAGLEVVGEAVSDFERVLGPDHPSTVAARSEIDVLNELPD